MDSIRVERLRCLSDTGDIKIKPLTVLLGQNSSGKSSFLRVFPLLKQSIESRTTGPILWSGRLVDFGNFNDAHKRKSDNNIALSFKFKLESERSNYLLYMDLPYILLNPQPLRILNSLNIELTLQVSQDQKKQTTIASRLILKLEDSEIKLEFNDDEYVTHFYVNSLDILKLGNKYISQRIENRSLLPIITEYIDNNKDSNSETSYFLMRLRRTRALPTLLNALIEQTKKKSHHSTKKETIIGKALYFGLGSSENMLKDIQNNPFSTKSWQKKTSQWTIETEEFKTFKNLIIANSIPFILEKCDNIITNFSRKISYMGPVRATAERYYRTQDLAVDEVDYQGKNLAMFLRNLTDEERKNFSEWTLEQFGFEPSIISSLGHISLMIKPKNSKEDLNIADTGFGFSQILPIITQLWLLSVFPKFQTKSASHSVNERIVTYAIEQPELHLHPRLQGTLTDAFVAAINTARNNDIDLRLVIETHSEVLVNRLGH